MKIIECETRDGTEFINLDKVTSFHDCYEVDGWTQVYIDGPQNNRILIKGTANDLADKIRVSLHDQ